MFIRQPFALLQNIGQTPYQYPVTQHPVPSTPPLPVPRNSVPSTQYPPLPVPRDFRTQYQYRWICHDREPRIQYSVPVPPLTSTQGLSTQYPVHPLTSTQGLSTRLVSSSSTSKFSRGFAPNRDAAQSSFYPVSLKKSRGQPSTQPVSSSFPSTSIIKKISGASPPNPHNPVPQQPNFQSSQCIFSTRSPRTPTTQYQYPTIQFQYPMTADLSDQYSVPVPMDRA